MRLSVIIVNYNYGDYVDAAIDSALAVDWPEKEIIVVDDGSTDHSRSVIEAYSGRVMTIFQANGGQSTACNAGFAHCSGDVVIFLDSDDVLLPSVARTVIQAWYDGVSKVQFTLTVVDAHLQPLGLCWPHYATPQTPKRIQQSQKRTGRYLYSPTSGNAWIRGFLLRVFPLPTREGEAVGFRSGHNGDCRVPSMDAYLSQLAPFFGDVICVDHDNPQGMYRLHGSNNSFSDTFGTSLINHSHTTIQLVQSAYHVNGTLDRLKIVHEKIDVEANEYFMRLRLICQRWYRDYPLKTSLPDTLFGYWRALCNEKDTMAITKIKWFIWSALVAAGPKTVGLWAVRMREKRSVFAKAIRAAAERSN